MLGRLTHMSECKRVVARLWDYRKGELADGEAEQVRAHLADCESCAAELQFVERATGAVSVLSERTPEPRRGWEEIRDTLAQDTRRPAYEWARPAVWALGVAALFAVMLWPRTAVQTPETAPVKTARTEPQVPVVTPLRPAEPNRLAASDANVPRAIRRKPLVTETFDMGHVSLQQPSPRRRESVVQVDNQPGRTIFVQRSSEIDVAANGATPTLVTGSLPVSSDALVSGSAPSAVETSVSVEPAFEEETGP